MGYWFPQPSVYRNAYLEEVGRRLSAYGLQLTADADAAFEDLHPVNMVTRRIITSEAADPEGEADYTPA